MAEKNSLIDRCVDLSWIIRLQAFKELTTFFTEIEGNSSKSEKYLGLLEYFIYDDNVIAQEEALRAILAFVKNINYAGKIAGEIIHAIVEKCLTTPSEKSRQISLQIILMYIEIGQQDIVVSGLLRGTEHENSNIAAASISALTRALEEFGANTLGVKEILNRIPALFCENNESVRNRTKALTVELFRWMGQSINKQLLCIQPALLAELQNDFNNVSGVSDDNPIPQRTLRSQQNEKENTTATENKGQRNEETITKLNSDINSSRSVDILNKIPEDFYEKLKSKNWEKRKKTLEALELLLAAKKLKHGNYGELIQALQYAIESEKNLLVLSVTVKCLGKLAAALKEEFAAYTNFSLLLILEKFKEKKACVVTILRDAVDAIYSSTNIANIMDSTLSALQNKSPSIRAETALFLSRVFSNTQPATLNKKLLKSCVTALLKNVDDPDRNVRENTIKALGTAMRLVGEQNILPFMMHLEEAKMDKIHKCSEEAVINKILSNEEDVHKVKTPSKKENVPVQVTKKKINTSSSKKAEDDSLQLSYCSRSPANATKTPNKFLRTKSSEVKTGGMLKIVNNINDTKSKPKVLQRGSSVTSLNLRKNVPSQLLCINNLKHQRMIDEINLKIATWNFEKPTEDFVNLLKELMTTAGVSRVLIGDMFHSDFRNHIKALENLENIMSVDSQTTLCNLDLILKWMTLRFFDTSPTLITKSLKYLQSVFQELIRQGYHLAEFEAASFIPYLIIKLGDPKDVIRVDVRTLFRQLCHVYKPNKIFTFVLEGLKSANARQRKECLDELSFLVQTEGVDVCQPNLATALQEIVKHISDRENTVRNAALNVVVQIHLQYDKIHQVLRQLKINEKDYEFLIERLRRASKNTLTNIPSTPLQNKKQTSFISDAGKRISFKDTKKNITPRLVHANSNEKQKPSEEDNYIKDKLSTPPESSKEFGKQEQVMKNKEILSRRLSSLDLYDLRKYSKRIDEQAIMTNQENVSSFTLPRPKTKAGPSNMSPASNKTTNKSSLSGPYGLDRNVLASIENIQVPPPKINSQDIELKYLRHNYYKHVDSNTKIMNLFYQLSSYDPKKVLEAVEQVKNILNSGSACQIIKYEDQFIRAVIIQFKLLKISSKMENFENSDQSKVIQVLVSMISNFYNSGMLGRTLRFSELYELIKEILKLYVCIDSHTYDKAISYNLAIGELCFSIIDRSDKTSVLCALLKLIYDCFAEEECQEFTEVVGRCLHIIIDRWSTFAHDLDYAMVLQEINSFLISYPDRFWENKTHKWPLTIVKTILKKLSEQGN